ncbi:MAG: DUF192 domain-containing protein [Spirochaetaceae bacterium]
MNSSEARSQRNRRSLALLLFLPAAVLVSCAAADDSPAGLPTAELRLGGSTILAEVAATPESRREGLMNREELARDRGMLFVFPDTDYRSFWMKNTSIPLSLAYIREDGVITGIHELEPFSLESVESRTEVKYALEVNRGTFERLGVKAGDRVLLPSSLPEASDAR